MKPSLRITLGVYNLCQQGGYPLDASGSSELRKTRMEAFRSIKPDQFQKGFHQRAGLDYDEVFSPVVKPASVILILSIALSKGWSIRQFDFNNAFLNGELSEEVFMLQPEGFTSSNPNLVCHLQKALHGLKQAPQAWFSKLSLTLNQFGFQATKCDISLFTRFTPNLHYIHPSLC